VLGLVERGGGRFILRAIGDDGVNNGCVAYGSRIDTDGYSV